MDLRRLVRGTIPWSRLEHVALELTNRYDREAVRVEFLDADNWLSTPCVVDDEWFVKIVTPQNALVHALFTGARNIGAFSSGTEGFFEHFESPVEMIEHELEATITMREMGLNVPEPVDAFEVDEFGVLVLEYLPAYRTLDELDPPAVRARAAELFDALSTMHDERLAHGDLRDENVLVYCDEIYFIDVTSVRDEGLAGARSYDLACALATLSPAIGPQDAVEAALEHYPIDQLLEARDFLDFVRLRPDHDFDAALVKGEIEKRASYRPPSRR